MGGRGVGLFWRTTCSLTTSTSFCCVCHICFRGSFRMEVKGFVNHIIARIFFFLLCVLFLIVIVRSRDQNDTEPVAAMHLGA
jgi:hypothetical protein